MGLGVGSDESVALEGGRWRSLVEQGGEWRWRRFGGKEMLGVEAVRKCLGVEVWGVFGGGATRVERGRWEKDEPGERHAAKQKSNGNLLCSRLAATRDFL